MSTNELTLNTVQAFPGAMGTRNLSLWDYAANADKSFVFEDPEYMPYQ